MKFGHTNQGRSAPPKEILHHVLHHLPTILPLLQYQTMHCLLDYDFFVFGVVEQSMEYCDFGDRAIAEYLVYYLARHLGLRLQLPLVECFLHQASPFVFQNALECLYFLYFKIVLQCPFAHDFEPTDNTAIVNLDAGVRKGGFVVNNQLHITQSFHQSSAEIITSFFKEHRLPIKLYPSIYTSTASIQQRIHILSIRILSRGLQTRQSTLLEELSLVFWVDLERQVDQEKRSPGSLLNRQMTLMAGHVRVHVPRTQRIHLNVLVLHLLGHAKLLGKDINSHFAHPVDPFGVPLFSKSVIVYSLGEVLNILEELLPSHIRVFPGLEQLLAFQVLEFPGHGPHEYNFTIPVHDGKNFIGKIDCPEEVGGKSSLDDLAVEVVPFPSDSCVVDQHIDLLFLLLQGRDEVVDALCFGHVQLQNLDVSLRVFGDQLLSGFLSKLFVPASHKDPPLGALFGQTLNDAVTYALVGACDND